MMRGHGKNAPRGLHEEQPHPHAAAERSGRGGVGVAKTPERARRLEPAASRVGAPLGPCGSDRRRRPRAGRAGRAPAAPAQRRSEEHTSELQSHVNLVCRLLLEKKKKKKYITTYVNKKKTKKDSQT